jgi:DNA-binding transcriptional ArsR family regulator
MPAPAREPVPGPARQRHDAGVNVHESGSQRPARFVAVNSRHTDVEQDHLGPQARCDAKTVFAVMSRCRISSYSLGTTPQQDEARPFRTTHLYALTRICRFEYMKNVESAFDVIAEPNRRAILSLLVASEQSVREIERRLRISQPAVSKHLRVLRDAGLVESTVDAQRRLYRLKPEALQEVDAWLAPFRRFWSAHVDALERHLDRINKSTRTKKKTRRRR